LEELGCFNNPLIYDFEPTLENIREYVLAYSWLIITSYLVEIM
jgi:hypothetical protein